MKTTNISIDNLVSPQRVTNYLLNIQCIIDNHSMRIITVISLDFILGCYTKWHCYAPMAFNQMSL